MAALDKLAAEAATSTSTVTVPLGPDAVDIDVLPVRDWRPRHLRAIADGDYDSWAAGCLTEASLASWNDVDPTLGDIDAFFTAWMAATGQDPGKSPASQRSSRSTARR